MGWLDFKGKQRWGADKMEVPVKRPPEGILESELARYSRNGEGMVSRGGEMIGV